MLLRSGGRLRWWAEAAIVAGGYAAYEQVRAWLEGSTSDARVHARQVIRVESAVGLYHEVRIQRWFLASSSVLRGMDVYYGLVHFVVPTVALVILWWRAPDRYRMWRNAFAFMLVLALVGFWLYPLMPPRLLPARFGFVDTTRLVGGIGPIGAPEAAKGANLYAAMPSLHLGWSTWCVFALWPLVRRNWVRAVLVAYPFVSLLVVVATANHYILDGVAGVVTFGCGLGLASLTSRRSMAGG